MGQEDYLNSLLNSIVDNDEEPDGIADKKKDNLSEQVDEYVNYIQEADIENNLKENSSKILGKEFDDEEQEAGMISELGDIFADSGEEPIGDIFASEEEPIGDIFASGEEPMGDIFASEEESIGNDIVSENEPMEDAFASEEEPIGDIFANEEEPMEDVFTSEEEPMEDIFASEEEPIGDIFASEEEPIGDIFASEEEPIGDIFACEEEPMEDVFTNEDHTIDEVMLSTDESGLLNNNDNLLREKEIINFDEENETKLEKMNRLDETESVGSEQDTDEHFDEEDIFGMFSTGDEQETSLDLEETNDGPMDNKSLFDDDLMKLLGEEDLSTEDIIAGSDEEELLQALKSGGISNPVANAEKSENKKEEQGGLFSKLFKKSEDSNTDKSTSKENDADTKEVNKKDKKKNKDKKEKKAKDKKEKKPKKEKAPKKQKKPKPVVIEEPTPPLHKGSVIAIFILFLSIGAFVIIGSDIVPYSVNINNAERYYEREQYQLAFAEMEGLSVKEKDLAFYRKLELLMILNNQFNEYQVFDSLSLKPEALDSLLKGVAKYDEHYAEAQQYGIEGKYDVILEQFTNELNNKFQVSVDTARTINASATREEYSTQVYNITK